MVFYALNDLWHFLPLNLSLDIYCIKGIYCLFSIQKKRAKDSSITINNSNKTEEEWSPHRKVSGVEQTTFTVKRKLNVEIDMNGDQDSEKKEWVVNYATEEDNSEKKDDEKENWKK